MNLRKLLLNNHSFADYSKSTIFSLCAMDHNKINYDLIVALLEWIVGEEHEVINLRIIYVYSSTFILFTSEKL